MKLFNRIAAAGALVVLNGAVALAQSDMKLDVPFAFNTPTAQMPAGKYHITELTGVASAPFYRVQHSETGKTVVVVGMNATSRSYTQKLLPAQVAFQCAAGQCAISEIFPLASATGVKFPVKLTNVPKDAQVAILRIPASAE